MEIGLTPYEMAMAAKVGLDRTVQSIEKGLSHAYGSKNGFWDGLKQDVLGAMGELAVAKATGTYWSGSVGTFKRGGDVGQWQVRTTEGAGRRLLVRPQDPDESRYYLVRPIERGREIAFDVVGHIGGREAKEIGSLEPLAGRPPVYCVRDDQLTPCTNQEFGG